MPLKGSNVTEWCKMVQIVLNSAEWCEFCQLVLNGAKYYRISPKSLNSAKWWHMVPDGIKKKNLSENILSKNLFLTKNIFFLQKETFIKNIFQKTNDKKR